VVETTTSLQTRQNAASGDGSDAPAPVFPLVTVCVVAHNPGAWFEEVLRSLLAQDYPSLDLVVVDAASEVPVAPRVHAIIPEATVVPLIANQGFAKNANTILEHPGLGPYLLICHDDVALAPDCIRRLIEETLRSNAGVVGPKLLDWNDPNRILHVGLGADKTGLVSDLAEPGEYDQEQHDAVRDVFAVPGAVTLLRTDLFQALEGFDEAMLVQGEDLDLCWRAHALGARVLVNPAATARHREDLTTRIVGADRDRFSRRHRIRSMLSNYGLAHTLRVVPQAIIASLVNIVLALSQGRLTTIADIFSAWAWNITRIPQIRRRRRQLAQVRQVSDSEVRALQLPGFEGLSAWRKRRADRRLHASLDPDDPQSLALAAERRRWFQASILVWTGVVIVLLFGSRSLINSGLPVFNEFTSFPQGPTPILNEWNSTWRSTGVGTEAPSSLLHFLLGLGGIALFGQVGLLRLLVTVGLLGVGAVGAYRLLTPFRSRPAQLVALMVYVAAPLPYNALHGGSWAGLAAYGAMPWIAKRLAIAAGIPPYGDVETSSLRRLADTALVAVAVALASLIEPLLAASLVLLTVGWILGGLATRRVVGLGRLIGVTVGAAVIAFVMLMPASLGLVRGDATWSTVGGTGSTSGRSFSLSELFRFAIGPHGATAAGWALLVVPALALVLGFGQRLAWAARSWIVAVGSIGIAWWAEQSDTVAVADPYVLLAPAAMSLAFAAGMAAIAFQRDLRRFRFGWRQLVPFVAGAALIVSSVAGLGGALDGRWQVVDDGYDSVFSFFDDKAPAHARTLWIGDADVLPVEGWAYDDKLTYALTHARLPTVLDHSPGNVDAQTRAPAPFSTIERVVDPMLKSRLTEQLDLVRVEVRPGATIYENRAYVPTVSSFPSGALGATPFVPVNFNLALPQVTSVRSYTGLVQPGELYVAAPVASNWTLTVNGQQQERLRAFQWAQVFVVDSAGQAELEHQNSLGLRAAAAGQVLGWAALILVLIVGRRRRV